MTEGTIVRRAGRPRKIKDESVTQEPEQKKDVPTISKTEKKDGNYIQGIRGGKEKVYPYHGNEYVEKGNSYFFVNGNPTVGYKLIRVYTGERGRLHRSLEKTLKPRKKNERGFIDREILKKLKAIGVSGIL